MPDVFPIKEFRRSVSNHTSFVSPLMELEGFHPLLIFNDPLHVAYRGFVPDFLASAFQCLFPDADVLLEHIRDYCRVNNWCIGLDEIAYTTENGYPSLNCKGYDAKILALFLARGPVRLKFFAQGTLVGLRQMSCRVTWNHVALLMMSSWKSCGGSVAALIFLQFSSVRSLFV